MHLASYFSSIQLGSTAHLSRTEILQSPDTFFDVLPFELNRPPIISNAANCNMDVPVFGL